MSDLPRRIEELERYYTDIVKELDFRALDDDELKRVEMLMTNIRQEIRTVRVEINKNWHGSHSYDSQQAMERLEEQVSNFDEIVTELGDES
jgi:hypothetical protein